MALNRVLLPAPFGPTTPIRVPAFTSKVTLLRGLCPSSSTVTLSSDMLALCEFGSVLHIQCPNNALHVCSHHAKVRVSAAAL